ncbi:MAG: hypothetical protein ACW98K_18180 [Candidatus Kariarchaeaceae archaeon]|jgi:hypothetical protein
MEDWEINFYMVVGFLFLAFLIDIILVINIDPLLVIIWIIIELGYLVYLLDWRSKQKAKKSSYFISWKHQPWKAKYLRENNLLPVKV